MVNDKGSQRSYRSPLREEAAQRTRAIVLDAAARVFVEQGFAGATIDQIAARAGVSRPTVFGVGNKAQLFALASGGAGAGRQLPGGEERFQEILAIGDPRELLDRFAAFTAADSRRLGPLQFVLEQAATTDSELAQLLESSQQELLRYARGVVAALAAAGALRPGLSRGVAADVLWLQIQPTQYRRLVGDRGWSHRAFERWHAAAMRTALLESAEA